LHAAQGKEPIPSQNDGVIASIRPMPGQHQAFQLARERTSTSAMFTRL